MTQNLLQYTDKVITVVMSNLKKGVSGSIIADTLVNDYGFNREGALTVIAGTMLILERVKNYK